MRVKIEVFTGSCIVAPPATTPRAKELYETMAREMPFDPRKEHGS